MQPLLAEERSQLVSTLLARYHKQLTNDESNSFLGNQMALLMAKEMANSPLYVCTCSACVTNALRLLCVRVCMGVNMRVCVLCVCFTHVLRVYVVCIYVHVYVYV